MPGVLSAAFLIRQLCSNQGRRIVLALPFLLCATLSIAQGTELGAVADSDQDGMSDRLEQALLTQFAPTFMISRQECSLLPVQFSSGVLEPKVQAQNGTIYGEVFPVTPIATSERTAEIHFYHLWREDCGAHGHPLDAEHVSVLVRPFAGHQSVAWKALYWYAAAHQNTVCDVSQITRASTIHAEERGATVWISAGKHASFLNPTLCERGCGGDLCQEMAPLAIREIVNLGEPNRPMNGSLWINSGQWPLAIKMNSSDFPASALGRMNQLPLTEIAWFNAGKHPMQGTIAISGLTAARLASSGNETANAISISEQTTSSALKKSYRNTIHALDGATRRVGKVLGLNSRAEPAKR